MEMLKYTFAILLSFFIIFSATQCLDVHQSQLSQGSSLSVENAEDILISRNQVFTAGFYKVGRNTFCFAIWFTNSANQTVAWMANRDQPVNGRYSKLKLMNNGDIHLTDAWRSKPVWSSNTITTSRVKLILLDSGNLVLMSEASSNKPIWQSFDFPTNTLLPDQLMTRDVKLISSISHSNHSSGFYKFFFDNDNVLRLLFDGPEISSIFWPDPGLVTWDSGRSTYNDSRVAQYGSSGHFKSSDHLEFYAADFGDGPQRRLTLDFDGNLRLYSMQQNGGWEVTWLAFPTQCDVHGLCGPNSLCEYVPNSGRRCSCLPGFKLRKSTSWVFGCEQELSPKDGLQEGEFVIFNNTEFYGYDITYLPSFTTKNCEEFCRNSTDCKAFLVKPKTAPNSCYPKTLLLNGYHSPNFYGTLYLKVPKNYSPSLQKLQTELNCGGSNGEVILNRSYRTRHKEGLLKFMLVFVSSLGVVELLCIFVEWCFLLRAHDDPGVSLQGYVQALTIFRRFSYSELRKATSNFREEIGRGGSGIVYKGKLPDGNVIAVKKLNDEGQREAEFLAEVNTIGRLKHMNLIELLGYCLDGKKRLLVFDFMENRSLAENLSSNSLNWEKRLEIALGTAKGLAYLHEECLEWVLHCDVKPQNILLDSEYQPKVADFGLSKLVKRDGSRDSNFSRIRGTRGYMAPEWVSNLPITSKVDVYSYGVVMLEIVTGKNPFEMEQQGLVTWVKEMKNATTTTTLESWIEEIVDSALEGSYDINEMKTLALVALQCVEEDMDARPTMNQVVDMLQK